MDLDRVIGAVGDDLRRTGAIGGPETARVVELLVAGIEASLRLHLLEGLHEVAREIAQSDPGIRAEVRMEGGQAMLVLTSPSADKVEEAEPFEASRPGEGSLDLDYRGEDLARVTLRLPGALKARIDEAAASSGASINSWIVLALGRVLEAPAGWPQGSRRMPRRMTGFIKA